MTSTEVRKGFDLPEIGLRVVEHVLEYRRCDLGRTTMALVPAWVDAPTQYGPALRGLATHLLAAPHLPLASCAELLAEELGAAVSQGTLAASYTPPQTASSSSTRRRLADADSLGAGQPGIRVDGRPAWVYVSARTQDLTRYTFSAKRGIEAMTAAAVLPRLRPDTVLVHDFWAPYSTLRVAHAVCGARLLRGLAAAEADGQGARADRLLCEINATTIAARDAGADRLAPDLRVPFTSNGSEQDVRPVKIRMKIAGCLRTMAGAEAFCRLRSYLSTASRQGQSGFAVLRQLHDGSPWVPALQMS